RAPLVEELSDLAEDEGVAFERRRVVGLEVPDVRPDRLRFLRRRQTSEPFVQLVERVVEPLVDRCPTGSSSCHAGVCPFDREKLSSRCVDETNLSTLRRS